MTPPTITPLESYAALPGDTEYWPVIFADVHDQTPGNGGFCLMS